MKLESVSDTKIELGLVGVNIEHEKKQKIMSLLKVRKLK